MYRVMAKSAQGPEDNPNSRHLLSQRRRSCQQGIAVQAGRLLPSAALAARLAMRLQIVGQASDLPGGM
jgi:hypothetical protein